MESGKLLILCSFAFYTCKVLNYLLQWITENILLSNWIFLDPKRMVSQNGKLEERKVDLWPSLLIKYAGSMWIER